MIQPCPFTSTIDSTKNNFSGTILAPTELHFVRQDSPIPASPFHSSPSLPHSQNLSHLGQPFIQCQLTQLSSITIVSSSSKVILDKYRFLWQRIQLSLLKIRQLDIYVDNHLTVHGIDGVLDHRRRFTVVAVTIRFWKLKVSKPFRNFILLTFWKND